MSYSKFRFLVYSLIVLISLVSFSTAQNELPNETVTEVKILGGTGGKNFRCFPTDSLIVTKEEFEKLLEDERCSPLKSLEIDFSTHTLINYRVGGDCHMRVTHKIFRNDKTKIYTVAVNNYWGRCRAGGSYQGWVVIDKIPADYKVKLKEEQIDEVREREKDSVISVWGVNLPNRPPSIKFIKSEQVDLDGCIPMYRQDRYIIKNKESYLQNIRNDAQTEQCKANAENLDFEKYSYIGLLVRSGYCRYPKGLEHSLTKDNSKKQYVLTVSYIDPEGQVCRALSRFDLWLSVPGLEDGYEVVFRVEPRPRNDEN